MLQEKQTPVFINLMAIGHIDGVPDYPIQFMTKGILHYQDPNTAVLTYTETQPDDETGGLTTSDITLSMKDKQIIMQRTGEFSNTMVFVRGMRYEGAYHTPFGDIPLAIHSRRVDCSIGEQKGAIHLKYALDVQGSHPSIHELHLEYVSDAPQS